MFLERFSDWYFTQPEMIQRAVLFGPPLLVSAIIGLALGGRARLIWLAWKFGPTAAGALDSLRRGAEVEAESDWTRDARASVDELVARRRRGLH
jgi:hypothetical protein